MQNVKSQSRYALFLLRESVLEVLSKYPNKRLSLGEIRQRIGLPVLREDNIKSNKLTHGVIDYLLEDGLGRPCEVRRIPSHSERYRSRSNRISIAYFLQFLYNS